MKFANLIEFMEDFEKYISRYYREDIHRCTYAELKDALSTAMQSKEFKVHRVEVVPDRFEVLIKVVDLGGFYIKLNKTVSYKALCSYLQLYEIKSGAIY